MLIEDFEQLKMVSTYPPSVLLYDIFRLTEPWMEQWFDFQGIDQTAPDYACAVKQVVCQHTWGYHVPVLTITTAFAAAENEAIGNVEIPADMRSMIDDYRGHAGASNAHRGSRAHRVINCVIFAMMSIRSVLFVFVRTRLALQPLNTFLAADHLEDERDIRLFYRLQKYGPIALVGRMGKPDSAKLQSLDRPILCTPKFGRYGLRDCLAAIREVIGSGLRLLRYACDMEPHLYLRIAALPLKRVSLRALLERLRPTYYWGRDPYNVDHILRHQELRRIGAQSFATSDGYPAYCIIFPHFRYVSYDRFYLYGDTVVPHYRHTWPKDMVVIPSASISLSEEHLASRDQPRPGDIAIFTAIHVHQRAVVDIARGLAQAFPDRTIYIQLKRNLIEIDAGQMFVAKCREGLSNVEFTRLDVYELMKRVRYAFSDPSSVIYEAIQAGVRCFAMDTNPDQLSALYRECPDICVSDPESAIARIKDMEAQKWHYPFRDLECMIDLSGQSLNDTVCADIANMINAPAGVRITSEYSTAVNRI